MTHTRESVLDLSIASFIRDAFAGCHDKDCEEIARDLMREFGTMREMAAYFCDGGPLIPHRGRMIDWDRFESSDVFRIPYNRQHLRYCVVAATLSCMTTPVPTT